VDDELTVHETELGPVILVADRLTLLLTAFFAKRLLHPFLSYG
jgi:hypothetical protein